MRLKGWFKSVQVVTMIAIVAKQQLEGEELSFGMMSKGRLKAKLIRSVRYLMNVQYHYYGATSMTGDSNQASIQYSSSQ